MDVEEARPAGHEHEIRSPGGREGCSLGMGGGVDEGDGGTGFANGGEGVLQLRCVGRGDRGPFGVAELRPGARAGLRVQVDDGGAIAGFRGGAGKVQGERGLAGAAFLGDESNDAHG